MFASFRLGGAGLTIARSLGFGEGIGSTDDWLVLNMLTQISTPTTAATNKYLLSMMLLS